MVAVEEAVRIREKDDLTKITLISVASPATKRVLHRCLASGADEAILLWDSSFDNLNKYDSAVILAKVISTLQYDLILCGRKAIDTEDGHVGSTIAEILGIPIVSAVVEIDILPDHKKVNVESKLEKGNRERVEVTLPALLTVDVDLNEPRYASLPSLVAGLRKNVREYKLEELEFSSWDVGSEGAKTKTIALAPSKPRPKKMFTPDSQLSAEQRMQLIISGGVKQKQGDLLKGNPKDIASNVVRYFRDNKLLSTGKY
jgi:electron transfer flavoprotein beta subunit